MPRLAAATRGHRRAAVAAAVLGICAAALGAGTACSSPVDPNSCDGWALDRSAPVISGSDVVVAAPVADVWAVHTDVESYPAWRSTVTAADRTDAGPLRAGSRFRWNSGGMQVDSVVQAVVPLRCTLWSGPSGRIDGTHLYTFTPVEGGTLVHTEESWRGGPADADPAAARALLGGSLARGLADLKKRVETGPVRR